MKIKTLIGVLLFISVAYMSGFYISKIRMEKKVERLERLLQSANC